MVKRSTEDNSGSTTESSGDGQADKSETSTEKFKDVTTTEQIVQTNNDVTTTIIEEDMTDNVDRGTELQDDIEDNIDTMWGRNTKLIEDDIKDNTKTTTGLTENDEGTTKGHGTPLFRSPNPNRQIVTIKDAEKVSDINNENVPRDENNSSGETFSKNSPSTPLEGQMSTESIPELISEKKTTNLAPEEDLALQDTTILYQSDAIDHTNPDDSPFSSDVSIFVTPQKISRILGGPQKFEDDKFSPIYHSFKTFIQDFVNIISSAVKEKLSQEKSSFQFRESSPIKQNDLGKENGFVYDGDDYNYATSAVQPSYDGSGYREMIDKIISG